MLQPIPPHLRLLSHGNMTGAGSVETTKFLVDRTRHHKSIDQDFVPPVASWAKFWDPGNGLTST